MSIVNLRQAGYALAMLFTAVSTLAEDDRSPTYYRYSDLITGYSTQIDLEQRAVFSVDSGQLASFCLDNSDNYCVDSPSFHFAVPKKAPTGEGSWEAMGHTYTARTVNQRTEILGRETSITIIDSSIDFASGTQAVRYYYSAEIGLLGYEMGAKGRKVLAGPIGFGAKGTRYDAEFFKDGGTR